MTSSLGRDAYQFKFECNWVYSVWNYANINIYMPSIDIFLKVFLYALFLNLQVKMRPSANEK